MTKNTKNSKQSVAGSSRSLDLNKLSKPDRQFLLKVGHDIIAQFALREIGSKQLDIVGLEDKELKEKIAQTLKAALGAGKVQFAFRIDHTKELLREARSRLRGNELDLAAVFFATLFEHRINFILVELCERIGLVDRVVKTIIREANLTAKCTWVLELLGSQPLTKTWLRRINDISDIRNAFVHYKWHASLDDPMLGKADKAAKLKQADPIVRFLNKFEERVLNVGQSRRVRRAIKGVDRQSK